MGGSCKPDLITGVPPSRKDLFKETKQAFFEAPEMVIAVRLNLPLVNSISGSWDVTDPERLAAWETYVEIITRIVQPQTGFSQRDIVWELDCLEALLNKMRDILKKYGPAVGQVVRPNDLSFAHLSLTVINVVLRPVLAKGEKIKGGQSGQKDFSRELDSVYAVLIDYCNILAQAADVVL